MITEVSAGGVVFDDDKVLLLRKPNDEWVMPKGHLEPGETPEQAAVREVFEETGLRPNVVGKVGSTRYRFRSASGEIRRKVVQWYYMKALDGQLSIEPTFVEGVFLPYQVAERTLTFENDREILQRAIKKHDEHEAKIRPKPGKRGN